jgi:hypothetical protein
LLKDASLAREQKQRAQAVLEHFRTVWSIKYESPFHHRQSDVTYAVKVLRAAEWDLDRALRMVDRYVSSDKNYYYEHDHSIKLMADQLIGLVDDVPPTLKVPDRLELPENDEIDNDLPEFGSGDASRSGPTSSSGAASRGTSPSLDRNDTYDEDVRVPVLINKLQGLGFSPNRAQALVETATGPIDRSYIANLCRLAELPETLSGRTSMDFIEQALADPYYAGS